MTEAQWNNCAEPYSMLEFLQGKASDRKARLLTVGWLRTRQGNPPPAWIGHTIEKNADRLATPARLSSPHALWSWVAEYIASVTGTLYISARTKKEREHLSSVVREIFGPLPFRSVVLDPAWLTPTVKQLAESIYEGKAFDRLPILGDALEESGCADTDILNHCRQPGQHVRGCWAVDLILSKDR